MRSISIVFAIQQTETDAAYDAAEFQTMEDFLKLMALWISLTLGYSLVI